MGDDETTKIIILHFFNIEKAWCRETLRFCLFMLKMQAVSLK